jgi:hypothetical protein
VSDRRNLIQLAITTADIARNQFIEKHGLAPKIEILDRSNGFHNENKHDLTMRCVDSHIHFVIMELLKNSMTSHYNRYGTDADIGPTIKVYRNIYIL